MGTRQITCPTCSHGFAVAADARTAICPRCGKALPILSSGISLDFEMPIPRKKSEKREAPAPPAPPPPREAKLAKLSLRKVSEKQRPTRGFEEMSAVTKPASSARAVDLPPAPEATIPGDRGFQVEILPRRGGRRDHSDAATGIDLPMRPTSAIIDPGSYPESGVGSDDPTAVPHEGGELIQVESGEWPSSGHEQVVDDDTWSEAQPIDEVETSPEAVAPPLPPLPPRGKAAPPSPPRPSVPPPRRAPAPPPPRGPAPPPARAPAPPPSLADDPRVTAMRLKAIDDDEPLPEEEVVPDLGPPDLGPPDLGPPPDLDADSDLGPPDSLAPPELAPADFGELPSEQSTRPAASLPPLQRGRTASFHRDLSPSARVAALTDAIDDEVSREIPLPPSKTDSALYPPPQIPGTMTDLGLGPNAAPSEDDDAPLVLPDTGIMVFVPDQPIEERSIGEEKPDPAAQRHKSSGTTDLSPIQQRRRQHAAGGHGVAIRRPGSSSEVAPHAPKKKSRLWIALLAGSLVLIALGVGLVLFLR